MDVSDVSAASTPGGEADGLRPLTATVSAQQYLRDIWARRDFTFALPFEELRSSHLDTFLGNVWHLGNPLLSAGVYYLVFAHILNVDRGIDNYIVWLVIGVFAYHLTSSSILGGAKAIDNRQGLMRSFRFPRAIVPISNTIGHLLTFGFQLLVVVLVALGSGVGPSRRWLALPLVLLLHSMLNLGGAFVAARLNDTFRDVEQLIPFVLRLLQYTSGVMFSVDRVLAGDNVWAQRIITLNPIVAILDSYRWMILGTPLRPGALVIALVESVALLVFGFRFFRAAEHSYGKP